MPHSALGSQPSLALMVVAVGEKGIVEEAERTAAAGDNGKEVVEGGSAGDVGEVAVEGGTAGDVGEELLLLSRAWLRGELLLLRRWLGGRGGGAVVAVIAVVGGRVVYRRGGCYWGCT